MEENHHLNPNHAEEDIKDVACLVFSTPKSCWENAFSVYLIDITQQKVVAFLHLNDDYPCDIRFLVYESMLYMFGGYSLDTMFGLPDAYVLDLFQLAKTTSNHHKPSPTKLPPMNSGKFGPIAFPVGNKICVFDACPGHEPTACHFELYDPNQYTWTKLPDPCSFSTDCYVDAHYVKDGKLFIFIRKTRAFFVLNIGATTSPSWSQVDISYNLSYSPFGQSEGVILGSRLVCLNQAYELGDKRWFARHIGSVVWTDKTPAKSYEVSYQFDAKIFRLGCDRVCTIRPAIVYKPQHLKGKKERVKMDGRRSMFIQQSLIRKRQGKRIGSMRMIVNVCRVNASDGAAVHMEVLKSFTVPMYRDNCKLKSHTMPLYPGRCNFGDIEMVSLCHLNSV